MAQGGRQHIKSGGGGGHTEVYVIFEDQYLSRLKKIGVSIQFVLISVLNIEKLIKI